MDLNQSHKLYEDCETPNKKETDKIFKKKVSEFIKREDDIMSQMFNSVGIEKDSKNEQILDPKGRRIRFKMLSEANQKVRSNLRKKLYNAIPQAESDFFTADSEIRKHPRAKSNSRDFVCLFGDRVKPSSEELRGVNVAFKLSNPDISAEDKNKLFSRYLDDVMKASVKLLHYGSDKDFVEKFSQLRTAGVVFMGEHIDLEFSEVANCELDDKVKEKYQNYKALMQSFYAGVNATTSRITDPSYPYLKTEDVYNIGKTFEDFGVSLDCKNIKFSNQVTCQPLERAAGNISALKLQPMDEKAFEALRICGTIEDGSEFFDEQGKKLTNKEAGLLIGSHKNLGIISKSGKMSVLNIDEKFSINNTDIPLVNDKKPHFEKMLADLDKGTSMFTKSGEIYKRMRSTLTNLVNGKGNEKELLSKLEEDAHTYIEKHYGKSKISSTAEKRLGCVENMLNDLNEFKLNQSLGEVLRANNPVNNKEANDIDNSRKLLAPLEEDQKNSSSKNLINSNSQGSHEKSKNQIINEEITNNNSIS